MIAKKCPKKEYMAGYEKACRYIAFPTQGNVKTSLKRSYPVKKKEMCGVTTRKKITIKKSK